MRIIPRGSRTVWATCRSFGLSQGSNYSAGVDASSKVECQGRRRGKLGKVGAGWLRGMRA
jgi:hypothetical protein